MSVINAVAQLLSAGGDYLISRSVRLRASASAYFSKTFGSAGNRKKWTYSAWIKRGALGTYGALIASKVDGNNYSSLEFSGDELRFVQASGGSITVNKKPAGIFRDPSAWYHIMAVMDTDNATAEDRFIIYKNGERVTVWASNTPPALGLATGYINSTTAQWIGLDANPLYFDGLIADVNFIDGLALPASSFGETDPITGVWKPKKYGGSFGTNGFKLDFSDNSAATAAAIGKDSSGNGNNWTPNNISVTAGPTYDSMIDVPTLWADGGNGRGNYCTLNPLYKTANTAGISMVDGNLNATSSTNNTVATGTIAVSSGKWYLEAVTSASGEILGWSIASSDIGAYPGSNTNGIGFFSSLGRVYDNGSFTSYGAGGAGTTIGLALDLSANKAYWSINGVWQNSADPAAGTGGYSIPAAMQSKELTASFRLRDTVSTEKVNANFGQRPFAYTPPTGFKALNTQNLPDATIKKGNQYFDATKYTGNGGTLAVTNDSGFQPDLVWCKSRGGLGENHQTFDSSRVVGGVYKALYPNLTNAEGTDNGVTAINSNGFTLGGGTNNSNGISYIGWQWKKGATQGFDIVTWTGNSTAGRTISHALGVAPKMIILKARTNANAWYVYHSNSNATPQNYGLVLSGTNAATAYSWFMNNTAPTSAVFSVGADSANNATGQDYVAYLFSEVAGYSKIGSYTGNGSTDGVFVYTGFKPAFVMLKRTDSTGNWNMYDDTRSPTNAAEKLLYANLSNAEDTWPAGTGIDILSNGFKLRRAESDHNASGGTYIFAAFAESPFKNSLAR